MPTRAATIGTPRADERPVARESEAPARDASLAQAKARLLEIIKAKSLLLGEFKLVSGVVSNYYLDMKPTMFDPEGAHLVAELVCDLIADERDVEAIGGLELGAVPIIVAVCARSWHGRPVAGFVVRKEIKDHGTEQKIDGNFTPGSTVILFDDVTTKGGSVMKAVRAVRARGARVAKIITLVDRLEGASENLGKEGIELIALYTTRDLLG
jgi:orotate phosphoribosyltransferase